MTQMEEAMKAAKIAAEAKYKRKFKTIREVEIHVERLQQPTGEVDADEMFKLSVSANLPRGFEEMATAVGDTSMLSSLREHTTTKVMLGLIPRNSLWDSKQNVPAPVTTYTKAQLRQLNKELRK